MAFGTAIKNNDMGKLRKRASVYVSLIEINMLWMILYCCFLHRSLCFYIFEVLFIWIWKMNIIFYCFCFANEASRII